MQTVNVPVSSVSPVDRSGGDYGGGLIRGVAVVTNGEARGHDVWCDGVFLAQVAASMNARPQGVKSRFTHPEEARGDGLGYFLGRIKNATLDGDVVRADEHFAQSARNTPHGALSSYLMDRAEEDPTSFGTSVRFTHDFEAERKFIQQHGGRIIEGKDGVKIVGFASPDPLNVDNLPHARLKVLKSIDVVGDPAANPSGLFSTVEACSTIRCDRGLPVSDKSFSITPEAVMPDETKPAETTAETPAVPVVEPVAEAKPEEQPAEQVVTLVVPAVEVKPEEKPIALSEGQKFLKAFGSDGGVWYAEGKSFDEAQGLHLAKLVADRDALKVKGGELEGRLKEGRGEEKPVSFQAAPAVEQPSTAAGRLQVGDNLAKFASGIKFVK